MVSGWTTPRCIVIDILGTEIYICGLFVVNIS
jgi:hypothetical protein